MAILEEFELYREGDKADIFITLRNTTITFSAAAVKALNFSEYVHMFIDRGGQRVAFQACEKDPAAICFYQMVKEKPQRFVRIANKKRAQVLMELAGIKDCGKGTHFYGEFIDEENVLVFKMRDK